MVYKWQSRTYAIDPNIFGRHMETLEKQHGSVTAKILLDSARDEDSPVHSAFEWDNDKAAEKYRLQQATNMIVAIATVQEPEEKEAPTIYRAYSNVDKRNSGKFVSTARALSDEEMRSVVLRHAIEELQQFKRKYLGLKELAKVFSAADDLSVSA